MTMKSLIVPRKNSFLLLFWFIFTTTITTSLFQPVSGYASWLKCFIELDPDEIVMHHPMVPPEEADDQAFIEVQPYGEDAWISDEEYTLKEGTSTGRPSKDNVDVESSTKTTILKVRLRVPRSLRKQDVQYVVEAKGEDVAFIDTGVMCDGSRAFAIRQDEHVILQINTTAASAAKEMNHIELKAGWAAGYEAVTITRTMTLKRSTVVGTTEGGGDEL
jgi:hypothetical protein